MNKLDMPVLVFIGIIALAYYMGYLHGSEKNKKIGIDIDKEVWQQRKYKI